MIIILLVCIDGLNKRKSSLFVMFDGIFLKIIINCGKRKYCNINNNY